MNNEILKAANKAGISVGKNDGGPYPTKNQLETFWCIAQEKAFDDAVRRNKKFAADYAYKIAMEEKELK